MSTTTETIQRQAQSLLAPISTTAAYPYPDWSFVHVNYFKDAEKPPPDSLNSAFSEHEIRQLRRSDDSPNVARHLVKVRNMRGHESTYNFDNHGFNIATLHSSVKDWRNDEELKVTYFAEVAELLKKQLGAKYVFSYEHHVRMGTLEEALQKDTEGKVDIDGPVRRVHIDESPNSARNEFAYYLKPNAPGNEHLAGRDFGIYNVWKPLRTIRKDPLCLCDARTLQDNDLQSGKVTVPNVGEIENFAIRAPQQEGRHEFAYLRGQEPHEAYIFRIFDSRLDGGKEVNGQAVDGMRSHGVAHTSFVDPGTEHLRPRESVEIRSFCVF